MDLKDQLQDLFPDHKPEETEKNENTQNDGLWIQDNPLLCKFEKRHGKPLTIIEGYTGTKTDFKELAKLLKTSLGVGGTTKKERIIIQGDYRSDIMGILKKQGFSVKRVGG